MRTAIYLGGVKGVGKTSLLESLGDELPYEIVDVTVWMMSYMKSHRDALDTLSVEQREEARVYAFERALEDRDAGLLLFDSHFVIPSDEGHEWGIPPNLLGRMGPFVLVTASPEVVVARRDRDESRRRVRGNLREVKLDSTVEEAYAVFASELTGQKLYRLENNDFDGACQTLVALLGLIANERGY